MFFLQLTLQSGSQQYIAEIHTKIFTKKKNTTPSKIIGTSRLFNLFLLCTEVICVKSKEEHAHRYMSEFQCLFPGIHI